MFIHVVGARPNFIKAAPLIKTLHKKKVKQLLIHTGQHFDKNMSDIFFSDLKLPNATLNLKVRSSSSNENQIVEITKKFESVCKVNNPSLVIVYGDVNSTLACAFAANRINIPIAHVESGLRSFDRAMPEEYNRVIVDHLSDFLFVTEKSGIDNLKSEGVSNQKIFFCGNTMIDSLKCSRVAIRSRKYFQRLGLKKNSYVLCTVHRPANVDSLDTFHKILRILKRVTKEMKVILPVHPRLSRKHLEQLKSIKNLCVVDALGYLDFMSLLENAHFVVTDSGGVQEETTYLGIPCLTLRENTERPVTVTQGTNKVVGLDVMSVFKEVQRIVKVKKPVKVTSIEKWDGKASERIAKILVTRVK